MARDYKAEYKRFHGKPEEIKKRAQRNAARAQVKNAGGKVAGKDVGHVTPIANGGTNKPGNLAIQTVAENRGYKRNSKNKPIK